MLDSSIAAALGAGAVGAVLALFEIGQTFKRNLLKALSCRWGWLLVLVNFVTAAITCVLVTKLGPQNKPWLTVIAVGLTFPAVLRSRLTLYRQAAASRDAAATEVSVSLERFYKTLQETCYQETNIVLAAERHDQRTALVQAYSEAELARMLRDMFEAAPIAQERAGNTKRLDEILRRKRKEPAAVHGRLALLLIDTFPPARVRKMVKEGKLRSAPVEITSPNTLVIATDDGSVQ